MPVQLNTLVSSYISGMATVPEDGDIFVPYPNRKLASRVLYDKNLANPGAMTAPTTVQNVATDAPSIPMDALRATTMNNLYYV